MPLLLLRMTLLLMFWTEWGFLNLRPAPQLSRRKQCCSTIAWPLGEWPSSALWLFSNFWYFPTVPDMPNMSHTFSAFRLSHTTPRTAWPRTNCTAGGCVVTVVGGSVAYKVRLKTNTKDGEPFWLVLIGGQIIVKSNHMVVDGWWIYCHNPTTNSMPSISQLFLTWFKPNFKCRFVWSKTTITTTTTWTTTTIQ